MYIPPFFNFHLDVVQWFRIRFGLGKMARSDTLAARFSISSFPPPCTSGVRWSTLHASGLPAGLTPPARQVQYLQSQTPPLPGVDTVPCVPRRHYPASPALARRGGVGLRSHRPAASVRAAATSSLAQLFVDRLTQSHVPGVIILDHRLGIGWWLSASLIQAQPPAARPTTCAATL